MSPEGRRIDSLATAIPSNLSRGSNSKTAPARRLWREARQFQEQAQTQLARSMVPFVEWLLLETLAELIVEEGGAVSQVQVAKRSGLSERVVSYWMVAMSEFGVVDRGPDADGRAWRVILTRLREQTLRVCNDRLEEAGLTG